MIAIYDFDGTLTPFGFPQYPILKQCGSTDKTLKERIKQVIASGRAPEFYSAFYQSCQDILDENGIPMTRSNICLGAQDTKLNPGVEEYFKRFRSSKTGIKHYIVTSGIKDYVDETVIRDLVDGIYGVTYKQEDGMLQEIDFLLTDKKKVDVIKEIQKANRGTKEVVYFGDGLTDKFAFEYVHSIGGTTIFVAPEGSEHSQESYRELNKNGAIDHCLDADFRKGSEIFRFMRQIEIEERMGESL